MPGEPFQYAVVRVVPCVEREEFVNAGAVLFCRTLAFLECRIALDRDRLAALAPAFDPREVDKHLEALVRIAAGDPAAGPIAALPPSERFGWLVAPSSTVIQVSPAHTGLTADPAATLSRLMRALVAAPRRD